MPDGGKHRTHLLILGRAYLLLARRRNRRHANGEGRRTRAAAATDSERARPPTEFFFLFCESKVDALEFLGTPEQVCLGSG